MDSSLRWNDMVGAVLPAGLPQTLCHADGDQHPSLSLETSDKAGDSLIPIQKLSPRNISNDVMFHRLGLAFIRVMYSFLRWND